jgi:predicted TPR repeat methyltransferase
MKDATEVFDHWASIGKDEGMEKGHAAAVAEMLEFIGDKRVEPFSAIDIGCGNGWVVRKLSDFAKCTHAIGIDGAETMIAKAKTIDAKGDYHLVVLPDYQPDTKVDVIHSMEFIYYLHEPAQMLNNIHNHWLNSGGLAIFGIDFYAEHKESHDWPGLLDVHMTLLSEEEWLTLWADAGFVDIISWRANSSADFPGTLVIAGRKI